MSGGSITRAEFDSLVSEVRALSSLLQGLNLGPRENSPSGTSTHAFSVVREAAPSSVSAATAAACDLPADRVEAATDIGAWVKRCLAGQLRGLSGRERVQLASKIYLVFRTFDNEVHNPPLVFFTWRDTKARVYSRDGQPGDSVFVGLPSKAEARLVVQSASFAEPSSLRRA